MTTRAAVDGILNEKKLAVIGVSRNPQKFGNMVVKELSEKGYTLFPVHPELSDVHGVTCYPTLADIPEPVPAAFVAVAPARSA
jgi:predicted CoA-binding protein